MARHRGRKLAVGATLFGGVLFGTVATAAPASAPDAAGFRSGSTRVGPVVDLEALDAAIDAARLRAATTTSTPVPPPVPAPPATSSPEARELATSPARPAPVTSAREPPPSPAPPPASSAAGAIARWFPDVYDQAVRVARCESGLDPAAVSAGGGSHGLFQINTVHQGDFEVVTGRPWADIYDADANARFARHLYDRSGWSAWACNP